MVIYFYFQIGHKFMQFDIIHCHCVSERDGFLFPKRGMAVFSKLNYIGFQKQALIS